MNRLAVVLISLFLLIALVALGVSLFFYLQIGSKLGIDVLKFVTSSENKKYDLVLDKGNEFDKVFKSLEYKYNRVSGSQNNKLGEIKLVVTNSPQKGYVIKDPGGEVFQSVDFEFDDKAGRLRILMYFSDKVLENIINGDEQRLNRSIFNYLCFASDNLKEFNDVAVCQKKSEEILKESSQNFFLIKPKKISKRLTLVKEVKAANCTGNYHCCEWEQACTCSRPGYSSECTFDGGACGGWGVCTCTPEENLIDSPSCIVTGSNCGPPAGCGGSQFLCQGNNCQWVTPTPTSTPGPGATSTPTPGGGGGATPTPTPPPSTPTPCANCGRFTPVPATPTPTPTPTGGGGRTPTPGPTWAPPPCQVDGDECIVNGSCCNNCCISWRCQPRLACQTPTPTPTPTPAGPWWQVKDSDVATNGDIVSRIYPAGVKFILDGAGGYPGVAVYGGVEAIFGNGTVSSKGWLANTTLTWLTQKTYDYDYFRGWLPATWWEGKTTTPETISTVDYFKTEGTAVDGYKVFYHNGNLTINKIQNMSKQRAILFVDGGNLTIGKQIQLTKGEGFFMAIVGKDAAGNKGNIIIDPTVESLEGFYSADNEFRTGKGSVPLTVRGSVVGLDRVLMERDLGEEGNETTAAEVFEYAPDLVFTYPSKLMVRRMRWKEVAP